MSASTNVNLPTFSYVYLFDVATALCRQFLCKSSLIQLESIKLLLIVIKKIASCLMSIFTIIDNLIRRDNYRFR